MNWPIGHWSNWRRPAGRPGERMRAGFWPFSKFQRTKPNQVNWNLETKKENYQTVCITFNPLECKKKTKVYQKAKMVDKIRDESTAGFSLTKIGLPKNIRGKILVFPVHVTQSAQLPPVQTSAIYIYIFFLVCKFIINLKQEIRTNPLVFKETKRATKANHQRRKLESDNQRKLAALLCS